MGRLFSLGALSAFLAVGAGAFGAHALKARIAPELLAVFETAVRYQLVHALAMLACAWALDRWGGRLAMVAGILFGIGSVIFCGSLYALALTGERSFGALAPVGGGAFLAGWLFLAAIPSRPRPRGDQQRSGS